MTVPVADSLGMTEPYGAIFDRPDIGSPAANAGIEAGDVVTAINGTPLMNWHEFATTIAAISPGTVVYLSTSRNGESKEINLTLGYGTCPRERAGQTHGRTAFAAPDLPGRAVQPMKAFHPSLREELRRCRAYGGNAGKDVSMIGQRTTVRQRSIRCE